MSYCEYCIQPTAKEVHKQYHDFEYGFPLESDDALFGRLVLEINQAGLSWETILRKKDNFYEAYAGFNIDKIAAFGDSEISELLNNPGIIRNKLKVNAAIYNAGQVLLIKKEFGTFKGWLDHHHPLEKTEWIKLFKKYFKFVGGEIVNEFLMSTGYLSGAHDENCPIFAKVKDKKPKWLEISN